MLIIFYAVYISQAFTNIPGYSIMVYFFIDIVLLYYHFKLRLEGGLLKELTYESKAYMVFFVLILIPGLFITPNIQSYLYGYIKGVHYLVLFIAVYYVVKKTNSLDFIFKVLGIVIFAYALTAFLNGTIDAGRLTVSEKGNYNTLAVYMSFGLILAVYFWNKGFVYKILSIIYIPFAASNIFLSGSRKGFLITAAFFVLMAIIYYWPLFVSQNRIRIRIGIGILVVILLTVVFYDQVAQLYSDSILAQRFNLAYSEDAATIGRVQMYQEAFRLFTEYPLLGIGYDNYKYLAGFGVFSHSTYAEVLASSGIIGTVIYFSIYISILVKLVKLYFVKRKLNMPFFVESIFLCFMLINFALAAVRIDLYDPTIFTWLACMVGYYETNKHHIVENNMHYFKKVV